MMRDLNLQQLIPKSFDHEEPGARNLSQILAEALQSASLDPNTPPQNPEPLSPFAKKLSI